MIQPYEITIGSLLRTNKGEIIRVESISTKRQHRKVGYHTPDNPCRIKYVRLVNCEGIELTPEILEKNGFTKFLFDNGLCRYMYCEKNGFILSLYHNKEIHTGCCSRDIIIQYIHQLQFALICAGLHKLANEIKI